ncbi:MAG: helix-turn-helix transcriptional regulator [Paraburkholderia sp.]|jgi:transcriptional regulator with XRE-family HTH domain|uniref:helix-turn-helix domain-containing protein n=1 Tax=Paraburkholderia sp. TaxID=1926495 RepID=UPI00397E8E7C
MDVFGERLKNERSRLDLNQSEFAAIGGVKQHAQFQYEKGMRRPNSDYLSALAGAGVDVWYLLTGEKGARLESSDEQRIIASFRDLDARKRGALLVLLEAFSELPEK